MTYFTFFFVLGLGNPGCVLHDRSTSQFGLAALPVSAVMYWGQPSRWICQPQLHSVHMPPVLRGGSHGPVHGSNPSKATQESLDLNPGSVLERTVQDGQLCRVLWDRVRLF